MLPTVKLPPPLTGVQHAKACAAHSGTVPKTHAHSSGKHFDALSSMLKLQRHAPCTVNWPSSAPLQLPVNAQSRNIDHQPCTGRKSKIDHVSTDALHNSHPTIPHVSHTSTLHTRTQSMFSAGADVPMTCPNQLFRCTRSIRST